VFPALGVEGARRAAQAAAAKVTVEALKADFGNSKGEEEQGTGRRRRKQKKGAGWWDRSMDEITKEDGDIWRASQVQLGNKATTVNRAWQRLRAVLGKAVCSA
jgi:hypothetical protein